MIGSKTHSRSMGARYRLKFVALASGVALTQAAIAQNAEPANRPADSGSEKLDEVVVTGTLIRGAQPTGSELVTLDRQAIVSSGALTTTNLMTSLPQLNSFNALPIGTSDFANPVPRFNIRATAGTLVLLNGHRMVGSGILQTTPDPSAIPIGAIERVEVLPDGASATYGADAVGGVVNFILRKSYDGAETRAVYGNGQGYHEYDLSQLYGKSWDTGNILGSFEYTSHNNFSFGSREYYTADLLSIGGRNRFIANCQPPNIQLGSGNAAVSYAGPSFGLGRNTCDPNSTADLLPYEQRKTFFMSGHQELSDTIELTGDAFYSERDQTNHVATSNSTFGISNTNPFFKAPPGTTATSETVNYWFANEFGPTRRSEVSLTSGGINLGLNFKLGDRWTANLSGDYGKGTTRARTPAVDGVALTSALAGTTTATAFDPFTGQTSQAVLDAIGGGGVAYTAEQKLYGTQVTVDGPLFALPGGDISLAVGAQWRHEDLSGVPYLLSGGQLVDIPRGPQAATRRDMAEYMEILVPIVGPGNAFTGMQKLTLSLAGRHDAYSDFGATTNPKFSLDYAPIDALTFHGTASSSFSAPSLADMKSVDTRLQTQAGVPFAPPGAVVPPGTPEVFIAGGTPTLQAQTAHTYSFGFDLSPKATGFNAGVTYWHSKISKQISLAFPTNVPLFTSPGFSTFWYGPGGQPLTAAVLDSLLAQFRVDAANAAFTPQYRAALLANGYILDLRRKNLGTTTIDGFDYHIGYAMQTGFGDINSTLAGVSPRHRSNIAGPGLSPTDLSELDPMTGRLAVDWSKNGWSAGFNVNYVAAFNVTGTDVPVTGIYRVDSYTSMDLRGTYRWSEGASFLSNTDVSLAVNNVFDKDPPFLLGANGYNAAHANQIGRLASISLVKRW
jgi:iron complex outermembrane receptor protein